MNLDEKRTGFEGGRRVIASVEGSDREAHEVTTGPKDPQTATLSAIYISEIQGAVEGQVRDYREISFVDNAACRMRQFKWHCPQT